VIEHDHKAAAGHDVASGFSLLGFLDAREILGTEPGARLSDIQFHGDLASVTVNGGEGGFVLLDVKDPAHPKMISRYRSGTEDNWYTKWSDDGRLVYLTGNGNFNDARLRSTLLADASGGGPPPALRGLHIVDVSQPKAPTLVGFLPATIRIINVAVHRYSDAEYVFASIVDDRAVLGAPALHASPNHVSVLRRDDLPQGVRLTEIATWAPPASAGADVLVHDLSPDVHPLTGALVLSAACWDAGAYFLDVTAPGAPRELGHYQPMSPASHVHTVKPHPGLIDGRQLTLASVETFVGETNGGYTLLDTSDPAKPALVGSWSLPGNLTNPESLLWSPHEFSLAGGRAYTSNYHAGTWALDLGNGTPRAVATWARAGDGSPLYLPRAEAATWAVNAETAIWHDGLVWVVDMGAGVVVLRET
jgi:hypothetical protein